MKSKNFIPLVMLIFFISCSREQQQEGIIINGQFRNATGKKIYFSELEAEGIKKLDSITLNESGTFKFTYKPGDAGFYMLKSNSGENILLLLEKNDTVTVNADLKDPLFDYTVTGSPGSVTLKDFYSRTYVNLSKADSLANLLRKLQGTPEFYQQSVVFDPLFLKIIEDQRNMERAFILGNDKTLASLIVLNFKFGMLPVLTEENDFDLFLHLDSTLSAAYPGNKHVLFLHQRITEHQRENKARKSVEENLKAK